MNDSQNRVVLTDIDVPFGRLVAFFVKAAFAAIPAAIIVWVTLVGLSVLLGLVFGFGPFWHGRGMMSL